VPVIEDPLAALPTRGFDVPPDLAERIGGHYLEMIDLLGKRTAQLHRALASDPVDPAFRPEAFSTLYQRSVYQSMRSLVRRVFQMLAAQSQRLPEAVQPLAREALAAEKRVLAHLGRVTGRKLSGMKVRIHGDYHLGQVLFTGRDFVVIDFEGEPARPMGERRIKRSPLRDVAGMIRSFHYAAHSALRAHPLLRRDDAEVLGGWLQPWYSCLSGVFLGSYLKEAEGATFLPRQAEEIQVLLSALVLEKAVYELGYELNNRPNWVELPLQGIRSILGEGGD
jgi:maltose alpha-D-glucosyltransferase/alpha-amylase